MHRVLADCTTIVVQRGGRLSDRNQYGDILQELPQLGGEMVDPETGDTRNIDGADFSALSQHRFAVHRPLRR